MNKNKRKIKFVDLFAGIGGFHKALEIVAEKNDYDIECVFVSEIDKEAIQTYCKNFLVNSKAIIDIRDLDKEASKVPEHDFLLAGFPCQAFSNAGKKQGFLDKSRGTLFFEIIKILKNKKPKYILLENVKHLVNHNNGETWKTIIKTLRNDLGYIVSEKPLILSPDQFGIPQNRKRVFIPGVKKEKFLNKNINLNFDNFLNQNKTNQLNYKDFLEKNVDDKYFLNQKKDKYLLNVLDAWNEFLKNVKKINNKTLPVIWAWELNQNYSLENLAEWKKQYILNMREIYLNNKEFIDSWLKKHNVLNWKKREQKFEWQAGKDVDDIRNSFIQLRQSGIRCRAPVKFPTFVAIVQIPLIYDFDQQNWRYLTPREVANLQSFPKNYVLHNEINTNNKDFYSYKQLGNAVNVKIVSLLQEYLLKNY